MAIDKKLICFARLEEFERQLAAGNILDKSIVFIQDANKIYNRGTYYDCQSPYVLPFDIETLDGLSYSDNEGRLQTDADVFEKAKSAIEMGRMVVIRYGLSDAGYHICDATYNGDAISVRVYNGLMLYSFEIYASSQGSIVVEQYSLQSELVDGVNIATINGQSLTEGGDLTIEGGAKVCELDLAGRGQNGSITEEEWNILKDVDILKIKSDFGSFLVHKTSPSIFAMVGEDIRLFSSLEITGVAGDEVHIPIVSAQTFVFFGPTVDSPLTYNMLITVTPSKTSQLENDSNFVTSDGLKTINGESIVGSGDITIQGGGVSSYTTNFTYRELYEVAFSEGQSIECNVQLIEDALRNNIPVFVPIDTDPSYYGYAVLEGYAEDLLYFSVKTTNEIIGVEISRTASEIRSEDINKKGVIATVEESVSKEIVGDLEVANTQALHGGGSVYALPDQANGDEDDILLSKNSVKTINGQPIVGSGDITISGDSSSGGKEYVELEVNSGSISFSNYGYVPFEPNKIYYATIEISDFVDIADVVAPTEDVGEYALYFTTRVDGVFLGMLSLPSDWLWANGQVPTLEKGVSYELSVVATKVVDSYIYKAVLTPFKPV